MAEIKLQRTAYKFRSNSALYIKLSPLLLVGLLASLIRPEFFIKLKFSWLQSITLTEVEPGKHELSSLRDIHFRYFLKNLRPSSTELLLIFLFLFTLLYTVLLLSCVWLTAFKLRFFYHRCYFKEGSAKFGEFITKYATHVFVNEVLNDSNNLENVSRRNSLLLPLYRTGFIYYLHDYKKFVYNAFNNRFEPVEHIDDIDVAKVRNWQGLLSVSEGVESKAGLESNLNVCADLYGPNDYEIPRCNFWKMLMEAFLAPFFVFQVTSTLLWIFDDYLYYSLISIFSMVVIEVQMVYKRILEYNRINSMSLPPYYIHVYRDYKWQQILTTQLYPGDIILLSTNAMGNQSGASAMNRPGVTAGSSPNKNNLGVQRNVRQKIGIDSENRIENMLICPCDCLILEGEVIVDESILTGESIPQFKTSAEEHSKNQRNSTIFSGTHIMVTRNPNLSTSTLKTVASSRSMEKLSTEGCVCLVIRTGFESYQGRLVHSILNSDPNKVTNNNQQGYMFLLLLLVFAVASVAIVVKKSNYKSIKKLLLVSSRILVSVIPPEFPITLSMAVTIGLIQLRRKGIYCTEPNRLPMAATIDVVAFDKTGTLTQDQMYLNGLYYTNSFHNYLYSQKSVSKSGAPREDEATSSPTQEICTEKPEMDLLYWYSRLVVAGCHSLTYVNEFVTGDPMEKIPFKYFENQIDVKNNNLVYLKFDLEKKEEPTTLYGGSTPSEAQKGVGVGHQVNDGVSSDSQRNKVSLKILKRWRFTSELGRMSVLSQVVTNGRRAENGASDFMKDETVLLVKGSPEKIKMLLRVVPVYFDSVCHELTLKGLRVLCLAYKKLYDIPASALVAIDRNIVEKDLEFCGFLALEAPIKNSSRVCMRRLKGHKQIMITGDNILTACHVTQEINLNSWEHKEANEQYSLNVHGGDRSTSWFRRIFGGRGSSSVTIKDYLKNYNYSLVDECPLSSMTADNFKKCPVYSEKDQNCPFLSNQKKEVKMHIQRCPLTQSLLNSYTSSPSGVGAGSVTGINSLKGITPENWNNFRELYNRNSYKRFIETCPANLNVDKSKGRCPLSQSNPDFSSLMGKSVSPRPGKAGRRGCPIQYSKRLLRGLSLTLMKIMFPTHYYNFYATPAEPKEEYFGSDNFGILSYYKGSFTWKRRNGEDFFPDSTNDQIIQNMYRLLPNHKLCITGTTLEYLMLNTSDPNAPAQTPQREHASPTSSTPTSSGKVLNAWTMNNTLLVITNCTVFARMSPQQKEFIIKCFKLNNKIVAMCGDGTNDIAALKQAHIGISLLNAIKKPSEPKAAGKAAAKLDPREKLRQSLGDELPSIKLGEASIASPFTYHGSDVNCVFNLVKSGRCALSNVFMLYKLMGINSLITALGMSILALDGVNFSDAQTTLYSLMYTYLVLALSKSKPSDVPSEKKPSRSIFSPSNFLSLVAQILIHAFFLLYAWNLGKRHRSSDYVGYLDAPFEPNIVNTLIYYVWFGINLSSFVSNYMDYPYMEPITSNKYLYKPILFSFSLLLMFLSDVVKPLNSFFSLVPVTNYILKLQVVAIVAFDLVLTYVASRVINYLLTE
ncbi:ion-translocating ATPase [Theileria orientalis]|uniref:Ion-translocating ATPase n=1 Tax=Theileria orientalis TaxID=68886 RepID=A0A976M5K4_THEOR|nr:ion-translocating ATPase [Theileria orientalis]